MSAESTLPAVDLFQAKTVLAIQPHYDDNDLGAGGTLAALSRAGARIIYLTVTDDQVGVLDASLPPAEAQRGLRREQAAAAALVGVHEHVWLDYPDAGPIDYHALRQDLVLVIRDLRPDVVFTVDPWLPYEFHQDHALTGRAVSEAIGLYAFRRLKLHGAMDAHYQAHPLSAVAYYFTHAPNTFFDITATRDVKHEAVRCYQLQFEPPDMQALVRQLEERAREAARGKGFAFAEALKVLRPDQLHIRTDTWKS